MKTKAKKSLPSGPEWRADRKEYWERELSRLNATARRYAKDEDVYRSARETARLLLRCGRVSKETRAVLVDLIADRLALAFVEGATVAGWGNARQRDRLAKAKKADRADRHAAIREAFAKSPKRLTISDRVAAVAKRLGVSSRTVYRALG